jgi:hypothetical protein
MTQPANALTLQLLEWISNHPRTYAEALDAWRTSCPRLSIWEDACIDGLIDCDAGSQLVSVSAKGQSLLGPAQKATSKAQPAPMSLFHGERASFHEEAPVHEHLDTR